MPAKDVKLLSWPKPETDEALRKARAAMPGGEETKADGSYQISDAAVVRWALRVAPLASEAARKKAADAAR